MFATGSFIFVVQTKYLRHTNVVVPFLICITTDKVLRVLERFLSSAGSFAEAFLETNFVDSNVPSVSHASDSLDNQLGLKKQFDK